ncbi:MAG: hypothetical protein ABIF01_04315 [Candidatus Micrarchaeota archaeon]
MGRTAGDELTLEEVVAEIRKVRLQRFFSLSERDIRAISSQHESMLPFLYEVYRRYGSEMDERMRTAIVIYLLSKGPDFEAIYSSLDKDASNRDEVFGRFQ